MNRQEQVSFIKKNYITMTDSEMGAEIGLNSEQVRNIRRSHNLKKVYNSQTIDPELEVDEDDGKPKYEIKGQNVEWKYRHGIITLSVDTLDQIFYEYSVHGLNLSQVKIQNKHGFTAIQWQSLKRTFDLVKDSDVFSPYTLSLYSEKEQCDMIAQKIAEKYTPKNMRDVIVYEDEKQRKKAYDNAIKEAEKLNYKRQVFETEILDYVSTLTRKINVPVTKKSRIKNAVIHVCDLHIGADIDEVVQNKKITMQKYNSDICLQRLIDVAQDANKRNAENNTIIINGDIIESFTGLNHINSWKGIDKRYGYGTKAVIQACDILEKFISATNNVKKVIITSGNHDRVTSRNDEDVDGEIIHWIHFVLKAIFKDYIEIDFSVDIYSEKVGEIGILATHGHLGLSKKDPSNIVVDYGFGEKVYHLVLEGHLHTRKVKHDSLNRRVLVCPSIFTGNNYSKQGGWSTLPGYIYIECDNKHPVVIDVPLN